MLVAGGGPSTAAVGADGIRLFPTPTPIARAITAMVALVNQPRMLGPTFARSVTTASMTPNEVSIRAVQSPAVTLTPFKSSRTTQVTKSRRWRLKCYSDLCDAAVPSGDHLARLIRRVARGP